MDPSHPTRVLVITDRTAATPALLEAIRTRAARSPCQFRVVVANPAPAEWHLLHPERHDKATAAEAVLALAMPAIEAAAGAAVIGSVSIRHNPYDAVEETHHSEPIDEIIISVAIHHAQRWLHLDLPHRLHHLGLPVTAVETEVPVAVA